MTIESILRRAADVLRETTTPWALIGGWAISVRTEPRFTRDLDLAVAVATDDEAQQLVQAFSARGFRILALVEQEATHRLATVRLQPDRAAPGILLDLLFASSGIEREVCENAEQLEMLPGLFCPLARAEYLLALKVLSRDDARRPQDAVDIKALLGVLNPHEIQHARNALELIEQRGFHRGRDLRRALDVAQAEFGHPGGE